MALNDMQIQDDDLIRTKILKELRSLQLRKSTDDTLKNSVISIGSMSKGSGYEIGVINRICSEMEEEGLIRWTRKPVIGDPTNSKRTFDITAEGRRLLDLKTQETPAANEVGYPGAYDAAYDAVGADSIGIKHINSTGPLILVSASILDSIELYRESVRGNNKLKAEHESHHTELLEFLDRLRDAFQELIRSVPDSPNETIENIPEVKTWRKEFWEGLVGDLKNLSSPESARKIALPATLIFSCGAIGGMIGGPVGYGVGTYVGKVISGEAKASAIGEKIEKALSESTGEPKP